MILPLYSSCHHLAAMAVQCSRAKEPTSWFWYFLLHSRISKHTKRA